MGGGCEGGSDGAGKKELIDTVLTCNGNIKDPTLPLKISRLIHRLQIITDCQSSDWLVRKVEPWNSVKVTFSIPKEAAGRLHQLAQAGDAALRQLGILSVQVEGDRVISLKVAVPNNETAEIIIPVAGSSGEAVGGNVSVSSGPALVGGGGGVVFRQHHQVHHPLPQQFKCPVVSSRPDIYPSTARTIVAQQRPQALPGVAYPSGVPSSMHAVHAQSPRLPPTSVVTSHLSAPVQRHVFPTDPPPPYPNQESSRHVVKINPQQNVISASQATGQHVLVSQSSAVSNSISHHSAQASIGPSVSTVCYSSVSSSNQVVSNVTVNRGSRGQLNMVKNSPLLVGLLQQPEQLSVPKNKSIQSTPAQIPLQIQNGPSTIPCSVPVSDSSFLSSNNKPFEASARHNLGLNSKTPTCSTSLSEAASAKSHTIHYSSSSGVASFSPANAQSSKQLFTASDHSKLNIPISSSGSPMVKPTSSILDLPSSSLNASVHKDEKKDTTVSQPACVSASSKKESQYLINPNTGLLEPRPNTDSSDSEVDNRGDSPDQLNFTNLQLDDDLSFVSSKTSENNVDLNGSSSVPLTNAEIKVSAADTAKGQDRGDTAKGQDRNDTVGWDASAFCTSPCDKIKLKLKLGKEHLAQATFIGNANKRFERKDIHTAVAFSQNPEPRVPKLHIKLHPSQPVIIKSGADDVIDPANLGKDDKTMAKRKMNKKIKQNEIESEFRMKNARSLFQKGSLSDEDDFLGNSVSHLDPRLKSDSELADATLSSKYKELSDGKIKVSRSAKLDSKLRTRVKKPSMRKVGDLNSVGEIASHKIMETLPPSITKVAAMHTQQPHCNPNALSPTPLLPSTSILSSSSVSSSFTPSPSVESSRVLAPNNHYRIELEKRVGETSAATSVSKPSSGADKSDIVMTKLRVAGGAGAGLPNGDLSHAEKLTLTHNRTSPAAVPHQDLLAATKLTIKRKGSPDDSRVIKSMKKDGLNNVPTFLNSSVLINKFSDSSSATNVNTPHQLDLTDKMLKKAESGPGCHRSELSGIKSGSDITIHSVSKSDILTLPKMRGDPERDKKLDATPNLAKTECLAKVGKVTCVDVMDRKALEEALKSSRNSSKNIDVSVSRRTSSMVDRLKRWNSIDSSTSVPLAPAPTLMQSPDSTNSILPTTSIKHERERRDLSGPAEPGGLPVATSAVTSTPLAFSEPAKNTACEVSQQSTTHVNVNNSNCDNSGEEIVDKSRVRENANIVRDDSNKLDSENLKCLAGNDYSRPGGRAAADSVPNHAYSDAKSSQHVDVPSSLKSKLEHKLGELGSSLSSLKSDVDSPEGTPKGEHGNGQGGEDSGIESMDALSEKSPNHNEQSPNRREEKECDMFNNDKCKINMVTASSGNSTKGEGKAGENGSKSDLKEPKYEIDVNFNAKRSPDEPAEDFNSTVDLHGDLAQTSPNSFDVHIPSNDFVVVSTETPKPDVKNFSSLCSSSELIPDKLGGSMSGVVQSHDTSLYSTNSSVYSLQNAHHLKSSADFVVPSHDKVNVNTPPAVSTLASSSSCTVSVSSHFSTTTASLTVSVVRCSVTCSYTQSSASRCSSIALSDPRASNVRAASGKSAPALSSLIVSTVSSTHTTPPATVTFSSDVPKPSLSADYLNSYKSVTSLSAAGASKSEVLVSSSGGCVTSCKNSPLFCKNSLVSSTAPPTMILLASTTSCTNAMVTPPNASKIVTLKSGPSLSLNSSTNSPIGRTFRLVALPGINSMAPSSPVKGQLVTIKPVVTGSYPVSSSSLLQTLPLTKVEEPSNASILKACLTSDSVPGDPLRVAEINSVTECDLDFVGFSSPPPDKLQVVDSKPNIIPQVAVKLVKTNKPLPNCTPVEIDPTPLRNDPPLFTYGVTEDKKDETASNPGDKLKLRALTLEDHRQLENSSSSSFCPNFNSTKIPTPPDPDKKPPPGIQLESSQDTHFNNLNKEKKLNELTIEIPNVDILPDEKRTIRTTRQSARLASPKVSSPAGCGSDVSPRLLEKRSPANSQPMGRPSPVAVVRSSVSPALKGSKRRRHLSESSNASSVSEDQTEVSIKNVRKRASHEKTEQKEEAVKTKLSSKDGEISEKECDEGSEVEDGSHEEEPCLKKRSSSETCDTEDDSSRPNSRASGRSCKTRSMERQSGAAEASPSHAPDSRAGTPTRRTSRQLQKAAVAPVITGGSTASGVSPSVDAKDKSAPPVADPQQESHPGTAAATDKKSLPAGAVDKKPVGSQRAAKKDSAVDPAPEPNTTFNRRKTRSTAGTATNNEDAKRRRLSKDK